jgi:4-amino-4-deoxy-L-arabinose transferase-like glycosyltransferase
MSLGDAPHHAQNLALPATVQAENVRRGGVAERTGARVSARTVELAAKWVTIAATIWFALALCWGLFGLVGNGHDSVVASRGIIAENMLRWHISSPVRQYTLAPPNPQLYYAHHPYGTFWIIAAFAKLLGRHTYVPRLVAVLTSVAVPPLLYGIGRVLWGPVPGALAALTYAVLPITLAFGNFPGFEGPLVFGCLLTTWGYLRFTQGWKTKWMLVSLGGVLWTVNSDWEANVFLAVVLAGLAIAHMLLPLRWFGRIDARRFMRWWSLVVFLTVGALLAYAWSIVHLDAVSELTTQVARRSNGNRMPLSSVLEARAYWIDVMFTPLVVRISALALVVFVVRLVLLRCVLEIFPIALGAMAAVQYVFFKNGADVHIYWPMPFAPFGALSVGVLAACAIPIARRVLRRMRWPDARERAELVVLAGVGCVPLVIVPDGVTGLHYARMTGGRFNDKGHRILREVDKAQALEWIGGSMDHRATVLVHPSMHPTWAQDWALHSPLQLMPEVPGRSAGGDARYFVGDLQFMSSAEQTTLASQYHVVAVGPYVLADRFAPKAPVDAFVFDEREPTPLEWYFVSGVDPVRSIRPDPFATWELRAHYDQAPNPPPSLEPRTIEELRIAHNIAVASNDAARAADYRKRLVEQIRTSMETPFSDGARLLGERFEPGVAPTLTLYFLSPGPSPMDFQFRIDSFVQRKRPLSLVPMDQAAREVGSPFSLPRRLWKAGFIYSVRSEIRQRPGQEKFAGSFQADAGEPPHPLSGPARVELLDLP